MGVAVTGAALAKDEARITIKGVPDRPGVVHAIFRTIAAANIVVDMIVQNVSTRGTTEISFTVAKGDLPETFRVAESAARAIGATGSHVRPGRRQDLGGRARHAHSYRRRHHDVRGTLERRDQYPDDHDQ